MRNLLILGPIRGLIFCLFLGFFACSGDEGSDASVTTDAAPPTSPAPAAAPAKSYPTETVTLRTVKRPISLTGRVVPLQEAVVSSQVPGIVLPTDKLLQEGKYYAKGEVMVRIDNETLRLGLKADRAQLATAIVPLLSDLSIDYADEYPAWEGFVNSIKADQSLPAMPGIESQKLRYFISSRGIPGQYYGIQAKEATLDDYTVRAPFSGRLTMAAVDPGSYVNPGQPLAKISRTDVYEVKASLPAAAVPKVATGQRVQLRSRNLSREFTGTINRFGTAIDPQTQSVIAYVRLAGKDLRSGLYLEGELPGDELADVAVLPREALNRDNSVYVITDGKVASKTVEVAAIESDKVYLRGLLDGDRVIVQTAESSIIGTRAK
ncbi:efflux RND transporter periplasmic adaptor subunit [Lewinella sp. 4G2]|uniref:efflux RND transporter periplasmic adaptor subunit n=1 Tax=Lewinella sp. 4G2 TaxID=1803372 RepID=UPI0007B4AB45|nr:efflux RND transporter periplasmic adaptor subunit [Lewinella sp. 4G2]OAV43685.1 hypothetical protein A3850_003860 [Lewinella sp. 4G2]